MATSGADQKIGFFRIPKLKDYPKTITGKKGLITKTKVDLNNKQREWYIEACSQKFRAADNRSADEVEAQYWNGDVRFPRLNKQWTLNIQATCITASRALLMEKGDMSAIQQVRLTLSALRGVVNVYMYTPAQSTCKSTSSGEDNGMYTQTINFVENKLEPVSTYTGIIKRFQSIEKTTSDAVDCSDPVHTSEAVCTILTDRASFLSESQAKSRAAYYLHMAEQVELLEACRFKRRYPPNSFVLASSQLLQRKSPGLYKKIRANSSFTFLSCERTIFSSENSNALPSDCILAGVGSAHAAVLECISQAHVYGLSDTRTKQEVRQIAFDEKKELTSFQMRNQSWPYILMKLISVPSHTFTSKTSLYGPAYNDPSTLANHIQTFYYLPLEIAKCL
ncbi:hypothetical protein SARC_00127 [Sphaeroforma arctica JP610]|uniref:Uncharacterized protein n=1 Tax=Sphaeroforma arctica JP610 TaxID=667725 RepID=A0A0L0GFC1_9EUKA|nr:hypothetical protein SARC_00127 [Sphaeroforma arctica JP610]KNC87755.1 hypothetical protein SARC_00127 [Sphaeroforma arctica JP610]|eukprot:XP_014161657.1 hypothetical protein SARC_00127 [Sphaeroforma arctica JP610]